MRKDKPFKAPTMRLRGEAHRVDVIVPNGATRPVLGTRDPGDEDKRAATIEQAGGAGRSPRRQPLESIELPLPRRAQTILTHRLPRVVQDRLAGGGASPAQGRNDERAGSGSEPLIVPDPTIDS